MVCATSKGSDQPAHTQSDQSLCLSLEYSMTVKLLTELHLEFLSLTGGCTGSSESTHDKMPHKLRFEVYQFPQNIQLQIAPSNVSKKITKTVQ